MMQTHYRRAGRVVAAKRKASAHRKHIHGAFFCGTSLDLFEMPSVSHALTPPEGLTYAAWLSSTNLNRYVGAPFEAAATVHISAPVERKYTPELRREAVRKALENKAYTWRTVDGVARETGLTPEDVLTHLDYMQSELVKAQRTKDGKALYTTRRHYAKYESFLTRLASAMRGRAI